MQPYWFSNRCPFFSAFDGEKYSLRSEIVSSGLLKELGFFKAAKWLDTNRDYWDNFLKKVPAEIEQLKNSGGGCVFWSDPIYPLKMRMLYHPAAVLFYRGDFSILDQPSIAIVGSRQPTDLGRQWVAKNMEDIVKEGITVVSGGARGIDYEAHQNCLAKKGKTACFLPGGVLQPYPRTHSFLFSNIIKSGGLLISEFVSQDTVRSENFHQRNRLIVGSANAVIIVEAALKSGTMMTATKTLAEHRELFVVPGSPLITNYAGSVKLMMEGAQVLSDASGAVTQAMKKMF